MLRRLASSCLPTAVAVAVVAAIGATAVPAAATPSQTGITVFLEAHHMAQLRQLAAAHGLSHAERVAALRKLLPSASQHDAVVHALRADGLTVTGETAWSVSASGPSDTVATSFGSHPVMRAHATPAQRVAAARPYPAMPSSLRGLATAAFPDAAGARLFHHSDDVLTGDDFRNAYTASGRTPPAGSDPNATLTIATIQLAGWNSSDLATWAAKPWGVGSFNANQLMTIPVDQATVPPASPSDTGDEEVDLDQESILSTDPFANQRAYFAPNGAATGFMDAFSQVLDDVTQDQFAFQGGDPHIVALSTSWGLCESDTGSAAMNQMEPILTALLAAGVTVFAASGDDGIYDQCDGAATDPDYPASSPEVVGVGGTWLTPVGASAPNNGSNWQETAWSCTGSGDCAGNGGSGGGASRFFNKPTYQSAIQDPPFASATKRLVPDIAAHAYVGDGVGFPGFSSDPTDGAGDYLFGGTSLAAPVEAALFTNALASHGVTAGVGDVDNALYAAYGANDGSFRDVTTGSNGASGDAPSDPSVNAGVGYDTVTGLGAPLWPSIVDRVLHPLAAPTATAALALTHPHSSSPYAVSADWTGAAAAGGLDVQNASVQITRVGHAGTVFSDQNAPADGSHSFTAVPGTTYTLTVTARDLAGTTSTTQTATLNVPIDDSDFTFAGSWQHRHGSADIGGSLAQTSHRKAAAGVSATGRTFSLLVHTGPSYGKLLVAENGTTLGVMNLYSRRAGTHRVTFFSGHSTTSRTFEFICLGKKAAASSGKAVNIDALYVQR
ncbi:MAG TPA: S53 family peptidase [Mycobacteriales bacterium]|nr:S53 family peptidase [Mycobacteriales bacterium]